LHDVTAMPVAADHARHFRDEASAFSPQTRRPGPDLVALVAVDDGAELN
jgi:hypothetical protein